MTDPSRIENPWDDHEPDIENHVAEGDPENPDYVVCDHEDEDYCDIERQREADEYMLGIFRESLKDIARSQDPRTWPTLGRKQAD